MILVLKNADFSENNLGQVDIPRELSQFTLDAIEASGNTTMTNAQKIVLDELFLAMGAGTQDSVMSKMRKVYLPIIAGDLSKALVNYADDNFTVDATPSSTSWLIRSHGLVANDSGATDAINLTLNRPLLQNNYSSFFLRTELMQTGVDDGTYSLILRGKANTSYFLGIRNQSTSSNKWVQLGTYGFGQLPSYIKTADEISCQAFTTLDGQNASLLYTGVWNDKTITPNVDMSQETEQTLYVLGLSNKPIKPYAVAMIGEGMAKSVAQNIANKINLLYEAFNV